MITPQIAQTATAWPFEQARLLLQRLGGKCPAKGYVLFQTGYGPSGLPHLGTFGEVCRTTMVRRAFETLTGFPTKLFAFSDDLDGLRKVPDNVPQQEMLTQHLGKPLSQVPDPFGCCPSFAHHNNAQLRSFLDTFGFDYTFLSASECYASGQFNPMLRHMLHKHNAIVDLMLPTLRAERAASYSPFMPISPTTGRVLQVKPTHIDADAGTLVFTDEDGTSTEVPVTDGHCKLQWKPDWAMRRTVFDVDYEMAGKDLTDSVTLANQIGAALGGNPPAGLIYELFLDAEGSKISKSKGNGLSIEEWLRYADPQTLALFMYPHPERAKRLHLDVIPKTVDEYAQHKSKIAQQTPEQQAENPVWHIHSGVPADTAVEPISFALLLNLVTALGGGEASMLEDYVKRLSNGVVSAQTQRYIGYALAYFADVVQPTLKRRAPTEAERAALVALSAALRAANPDETGDNLQTLVFTVGKEAGYTALGQWFKMLYETLFGQSSGPRFGAFAALYGTTRTANMIDAVLAG